MFKLRNHNIILPKYLELVKKKGSSLTFSVQGGGAVLNLISQTERERKQAGKNSFPPTPSLFARLLGLRPEIFLRGYKIKGWRVGFKLLFKYQNCFFRNSFLSHTLL